MRVLVSDYSGHPFQVQLSRSLARRGLHVRHTFSASFQTPKGNLVKADDDPATFEIVPVKNLKPFEKASFVTRRQQEIEVGQRLADMTAEFKPDVIISSNAPLDTQRVFKKAADQNGAKFIFWLQDIYSEAISRVVPRKFPVVGSAIAAWYRHLEFSLLRQSNHVVAITKDFVPVLTRQNVDPGNVTVIENWAPLDELPIRARDNAWAEANMPGPALRIVYSGTLGYKHSPNLLLALARHLPQAHVHVFSEGVTASELAQMARQQGTANLTVHPWVPFEDLPSMLSGADIFVAVIEPEAGIYSVPSKVLTYLAMGRPILASVPSQNLAARIVEEHQAGFVAPPGADAVLLAKAAGLAGDAALRERLGANARRYAERSFDVEAITDTFSTILNKLHAQV